MCVRDAFCSSNPFYMYNGSLSHIPASLYYMTLFVCLIGLLIDTRLLKNRVNQHFSYLTVNISDLFCCLTFICQCSSNCLIILAKTISGRTFCFSSNLLWPCSSRISSSENISLNNCHHFVSYLRLARQWRSLSVCQPVCLSCGVNLFLLPYWHTALVFS